MFTELTLHEGSVVVALLLLCLLIPGYVESVAPITVCAFPSVVMELHSHSAPCMGGNVMLVAARGVCRSGCLTIKTLPRLVTCFRLMVSVRDYFGPALSRSDSW